jgi:hypothetical protein
VPESLPIQRRGLARWLQLTTLFAAAVVACIYSTYGIGRSLWLDEANTVLIAQGSPHQIVAALQNDISPPLYYFVLSGWMRLFGDSEIALRLPSVIFYLVGIFAMWFLGRMLLGAEGAGLVAFLYAINPIAGRQAQNARMYTLLALLAALSAVVFVLLIRDARRRTPVWFALFGLLAFLGMNTHFWFAFVLIAYGCWLLFSWRSWRVSDLALLAAFTAGPFLLVDLAMFVRDSQLPSGLWTPRPGFAALAKVLLVNFGFIPPHFARALVFAVALSAPILWAVLARRCNYPADVLRIARFGIFLYVAALIVPFLLSAIKPIFWPGRYDIVAVPFFAVFAAALLLGLPVQARSVFQLLLACSCGFYFVHSVRESQTTGELRTLDRAPLGDRAAARAICAEFEPGDYVIYTGLSRAAVSYYLQRFHCGGKLKQISYPAEFERHMGWQDPRRDYSQEPSLEREGQSVAAAAAATESRIFLLYQPDARFSAGVVAPIEHDFRATSSQRFTSCEPCFSELRLYVPKSTLSVSSVRF